MYLLNVVLSQTFIHTNKKKKQLISYINYIFLLLIIKYLLLLQYKNKNEIYITKKYLNNF